MKQAEFSKEYDTEGLKIKQVDILANKEIVKGRKALAEHPIGIVKRAMGATYCLTRGRGNINGEFSLLFSAFNMKRAINIMGVTPLIQAIRG